MATYQENPRASGSNPTSPPTSDLNTKVSCRATLCYRQAQARNRFSDFVVLVDDCTFPCHRFVLSSCSEFFQALLRCDMRENNEQQATIKGITPAVFGLVLDAMYGSCTDLTEDNMLEVWHAANQLQVEFLVEICEDFILNSITVNNFWDIYVNAECLDSVHVMNAIKTYMVQNFYEVTNSNEFIHIKFDVFLGILNDINLPVCTDFAVKSILKWTNRNPERHNHPGESTVGRNSDRPESEVHSFEKRSGHMDELLKAIQLENASHTTLAALMTNKAVLSNRDAILAVNNYIARVYVTNQRTDNPEIQWTDTPQSEEANFRFYEAARRMLCFHCLQWRTGAEATE